ncbi:VanZ family protein [Psychroserpens sp. S379A]|uniref:VanZ family protein n=1 Tax=Psychroserpens sp. S379A TaxID=3415137 RepID=UPI003C7C8EB5
MTTKLSLVLKRWSLPIVLAYLIVLTIGSLGNVSGVPKLGFSFDDKIYHFLAYAILTLVLFNYFRTTTVKPKIGLSTSIAIIYGIIIEALQAIVTDFRTPDYYDVLANTVGAVVVMILLQKFKNKLALK